MFISTTPKVGDRFSDIDPRTRTYTKAGRVKTKRVVEIIALPTLSTLGVMRVIKGPKVGQLRRFTLRKLERHYEAV